MTTIKVQEIVCPRCGHEWTETFNPSICTWINPELVQEIYDKVWTIKCEKCNLEIRVRGTILINCPRGMFYLDLGQELEDIRQIFTNYGIVNQTGEVVNLRANEPPSDAYL